MSKKRKIQYLFRVVACVCICVILFSITALAEDRVDPGITYKTTNINLVNSSNYSTKTMTGVSKNSVWWNYTANGNNFNTVYIFNTGHAQFEWLTQKAFDYYDENKVSSPEFGWSAKSNYALDRYSKNKNKFQLTPGERYTFSISVSLGKKAYITDLSVFLDVTLYYACGTNKDSMWFESINLSNHSFYVTSDGIQQLYFDFRFDPSYSSFEDCAYFFSGLELNINSPSFNESALESINNESAWLYMFNVHECFLSEYLPVDNLSKPNSEYKDLNDKLDSSVNDTTTDINSNLEDAREEWDYTFSADTVKPYKDVFSYISEFMFYLINALDINFVLQLSINLGALGLILSLVINVFRRR